MSLNQNRQGQLTKAFYAALLLTGNEFDAETTVVEAISMGDHCFEDPQAFATDLLRAATVKRKQFWKEPLRKQPYPSSSLLPDELQRVLMLALPLRDCFVARVLLGLPISVCASVMGL